MGRRRRLTNVQQGFEELDDLELRLKENNLELIDTEGDGNCLFRSLSIQLEIDFEELRRVLVDYIIEHKDEFEGFTENLDRYCGNMRKDGVYGGNLELFACAKKYNLIILVHQLHHPIIVIQDDSPIGIVHIAYVSWQHYSGIKVNKAKCNADYCNMIGNCASKRMHRLNGIKGIHKAVEHFLHLNRAKI